jgi:hypothetical protein
MQVNLERGRPASGGRSGGYFAILAGAPLIAALALSAPDPALAACGASHPAGVHTATGTGVHTATSRPPTSGAGGGGGGAGSLGCPNGSSAPALHGGGGALHGLPVATSGRVVEGGARSAAHTATHARPAPTKATNASAHLRGVKPPHA